MPVYFIIFQGSITSKLVDHINLILPTPNILEKYGSYINYTGNIQRTELIFLPKKTKRESWKILSIIMKKLLSNNNKNYKDIYTKQEVYNQLTNNSPILNKNNNSNYVNKLIFKDTNLYKNIKCQVYNNPFKLSVSDYYLTDAISSNSKLMKTCSKELSTKHNYV